MLFRTRATIAAVAAIFISSAARGQTLPDSVLSAVRSGVNGLVFAGDSAVIPLVGTPTLPLVHAWVNGRGPYRMLVDIGSNVTLLRRDVVDSSRTTVLVERTTTDIIRASTMRIGNVELRDVTMGSYDELDVDGVLGFNVLQHASFTLDFPAQRLVIHRRALPPADGRTVHDYVIQGRLPYLVARIGADSLLMNLDTGAADVMTVPAPVESRLRWQAPPAPGRTTLNNQTGRNVVREGRLADSVRVGDFVLRSPLVYINPSVDDAWFGAAAMNGHRWTFDPRQRRIRIELP